MIGRLLALALAIAGGALLILRSIQREEREPIRIRNKKLRFDLRAKQWRGDVTSRVWRTIHPSAESMATFAVSALKPEGELPFSAATVTFKVVVGGETLDYVLKRALTTSGKWEPIVVTPANIEIAEAGRRLRIRNEPDVWISHVYGDGTLRYTFDQNTPEIDLLAKPQR